MEERELVKYGQNDLLSEARKQYEVRNESLKHQADLLLRRLNVAVKLDKQDFLTISKIKFLMSDNNMKIKANDKEFQLLQKRLSVRAAVVGTGRNNADIESNIMKLQLKKE